MKHIRFIFCLFVLCSNIVFYLQASPSTGKPVGMNTAYDELSLKRRELKMLRNKYPLPIPKATQEEILSAQAVVASYRLQRVDGETVTALSGLSRDDMTFTVNREVARNARALACAAYGGGKAAKKTFYLYMDYLLSQGYLEMVCGPSFYQDWRTTPADFLSMLVVCDSARQQRLLQAIDKILKADLMLGADRDELKKHINSDYIYIMLPHLFVTALHMPCEEKALERLEQYSFFISECTHYMPGGGDILKPDGVGFHHGAHYNGYMYCYNTWVECMLHLAGTSFHVTEEAYSRMRKAVMAPYLMATASSTDQSHFYGNSMAGRHPFTGMELSFPRKLIESLIVVGKDFSSGEDDQELQAFYNYVFKTNKYKDAPSRSFDGFYQFNYSPAGVYRLNNWVAVMRAPTTRFWGAEIYNKTNRFGRYQGHGTLEVLYEGKSLEATGYPTDRSKKGAGWDWNVVPGTTTVHYTSWKEMMPNGNDKDRFDQIALTSNFSGALSWNNCGIWAAAFDQNEGWGKLPRFEATNLRFCKSVFAIDGMLLGLGTGISAEGTYPDEWTTATNLFQSVQSGKPAPLFVNGAAMKPGSERVLSSEDAVWMVTPQTTGYYIPAGHDNLVVKYGEQESPSSIGMTAEMGKELVAKAYLNHGVKPTGKQYRFLVVPATTPDKMKTMAEDMQQHKIFSILSQHDSVHIVKHLPTRTLAYALFAPVSGLNAGYVRATDTELLVMERSDQEGKELNLALCNPNLRPKQLNKGWVETSTQAVLRLKGNWMIVSSSPQSGLLSEPGGNSDTLLKVTLKEGAPLYVTLRASLPEK